MATTDHLAEVEAEIARLETVRDWLRSRQNGKVAPQTRRRGPRTTGRVTAAVAAEKVLAAASEPMRTRDLLAAVQAEGASIRDNEGLSKTLSRSPEKFKKAGRGMWTLA